ncbi:YajQ family cyclic di-GMP-binding protein [sulfur-oxidizing endosymbiont of Gigantopelta aegis]|uniref:YajQ family cyclic di-GMP-binding protein n=1 Tax=sulfur-oxidizing endosymbiont of Gigantopelta aegis TaxID=2794934 RepID=UPI0018DC5E16|nr:YajQ family cyclic di-GMP-binding protein [sulfur-oxidizing endosymbiont of Gigantopelta aegis]
MPSFDIVSEIDMHELTNAVSNANRAITQRYDFKGTETTVKQSKEEVTLISESEFQVQQLLDIMLTELVRRKVDVKSLEQGDIKPNGKAMEQKLLICQGIDKDNARKIVKLIKDKKLKVQSSIQGEQVRVTGKKRDDLQAVMAMLKKEEFSVALQFTNFRD